jgi:hypothetical protein
MQQEMSARIIPSSARSLILRRITEDSKTAANPGRCGVAHSMSDLMI